MVKSLPLIVTVCQCLCFVLYSVPSLASKATRKSRRAKIRRSETVADATAQDQGSGREMCGRHYCGSLVGTEFETAPVKAMLRQPQP